MVSLSVISVCRLKEAGEIKKGDCQHESYYLILQRGIENYSELQGKEKPPYIRFGQIRWYKKP